MLFYVCLSVFHNIVTDLYLATRVSELLREPRLESYAIKIQLSKQI
jgi:hypothetical protein